MRAFKVYYCTEAKEASMIVLTEDETNLGVSLANKDKDFKIDDKWSKISYKKEIPLSNVMVSDLSVTELIILMKKLI